MLGERVCDMWTKSKALVSTKVDELKELVMELLGDCATTQCFNHKFQAMDDVLSRTERRFNKEYTRF